MISCAISSSSSFFSSDASSGSSGTSSFRSIPEYRHVATYRYLPARSLTLAGLLSPSDPGESILIANFATSDPTAERKRRREARKALHADIEEVGGTVIRPPRRGRAP